MEKKRPRGSTDESAAVKAAAWAWYQHGSGSEGTPAREYDAARPRHVPRPSRYKLEAMRSKAKEGKILLGHNYSKSNTQTTTNVSLLDEYEIQSISRHLDSLIDQYSDNEDFRRKDSFSDADRDDHSVVMKNNNNKKNNVKKTNSLRGFLIRHAAAVCGTREDVVETATRDFLEGRRRGTEDDRRVLPVVMAATGRPRWNHVMHSRG